MRRLRDIDGAGRTNVLLNFIGKFVCPARFFETVKNEPSWWPGPSEVRTKSASVYLCQSRNVLLKARIFSKR